jgi:hypothetical protein
MGARPTFSFASAIAVGLLAFVAAGPSSAATSVVIDTIPSEVGTLMPFGVPDTVTYGQTVKVPDGFPLLSSYAVRMFDSADLIFRGVVYAYVPGGLPGEPLWVGPPIQLGTSGARVTVSFNPNLQLDSGATYVIGATTIYDLAQGARVTDWATTPDVYPDGDVVYWNTTDPAWEVRINVDFSFTATFTSVSNGDVPAPILQQVPAPRGGCATVDDAAINWSGVASGGWSSSWSQWAMNGNGGPVCTRTLTFVNGAWTSATR